MIKLGAETKYAVLALFDMAYYGKEGHSSLSEISSRQGIPLRFLEQIFHKLKKAGIVRARRGPGGGYYFAKDPADLTVGDIIRAVDGPVSLSGCHAIDENYLRECAISDRCLTDFLWAELGKMISNFFDSVTIQDLCQRRKNLKKSTPSAQKEGETECA